MAARGGGEDAHRRRVIVAGASAHSSMAAAAHIMGCELVTAPAADAHGRLDGRVLEEALTGRDPAEVVAVVATAARPTPAPSTTWPASRTSAPATACGCTWTAPTAAPRCSRRARARCSTASSGRTRSSSTRTRCSTRRSTAPPWSTATARRRARSLTQTADYLDPVCDVERARPVRPRRPPHAPGARRAALGVGPGLRHRRLRRRGGPLRGHGGVRRRSGSPATPGARARDRAGVHGAPGAPARLDAGRLRRVERGRAGARRRHASCRPGTPARPCCASASSIR